MAIITGWIYYPEFLFSKKSKFLYKSGHINRLDILSVDILSGVYCIIKLRACLQKGVLGTQSEIGLQVLKGHGLTRWGHFLETGVVLIQVGLKQGLSMMTPDDLDLGWTKEQKGQIQGQGGDFGVLPVQDFDLWIHLSANINEQSMGVPPTIPPVHIPAKGH